MRCFSRIMQSWIQPFFLFFLGSFFIVTEAAVRPAPGLQSSPARRSHIGALVLNDEYDEDNDDMAFEEQKITRAVSQFYHWLDGLPDGSVDKRELVTSFAGLVDVLRSPRPSAPGVNPAVVPVSHVVAVDRIVCCLEKLKREFGTPTDCETVFELLDDVKTKICNIEENLSEELLEEIRDELINTITSFNDQIIDLLLSLTVFGELTETASILTELVNELVTKFDETWTALDGLSDVLCDKFEQTWTVIDGIVDGLDGVSVDISEGFQATWTIIEGIKQSSCAKFEQTWTILRGIDDALSQACDDLVEAGTTLDALGDQLDVVQTTFDEKFPSITEDFESTWTALADLKQAILLLDTTSLFEDTWTAIQEVGDILCDKFEDTWTALDAIRTTFDENFFTQKFQETWTVIDGLNQALCRKFEGTWTELAGIEQDIDMLEQTIQTTILDGFEGTWTALQEVVEISCAKFEQTWTVIAGQKQQVNDICVEIDNVSFQVSDVCSDIDDTQTMVNMGFDQIDLQFEETWTISQAILDKLCVIDDTLDTFTQIAMELDDLDQALMDTATLIESIASIIISTTNIIADLAGTLTILVDAVDTLTEFIDIFMDTLTVVVDKVCLVEDGVEQTFTVIEGLEEVLTDKFEQTWTILTGIKDSIVQVTTDNTLATWTVIDGAQERLCRKFEGTWTALQVVEEELMALEDTVTTNAQEINELFEDTWTAITQVEENQCAKFEATWTALQEVRDNLDTVAQEGFEGTWTALVAVQDSLCAKFEDTWTILNELDESIDTLQQDIDDDATTVDGLFEGTWTVIQDIQDTACDKFEQTWTALDQVIDGIQQDVQDEFNQTFTAIDEVLQDACDKFEQTWTIISDELGGAVESLQTTIDDVHNETLEDFNETFTAIDEIEQVLCQKFEDTWTIIADLNMSLSQVLLDDFQATFTVIQDIQDTICQKFEDTWTILADIEASLTILEDLDISVTIDFSSVFTVIDTIVPALCPKFEDTWTQLQCFSDTPITGQVTIDTPGTYCVTQHFGVTSGDAITVDASDVVIHMNGHTISGPTTGVGIRVLGGNTNIRIHDGAISGFERGIVADGAEGDEVVKLSLENMMVMNSQHAGIELLSTEISTLNGIGITGCAADTTSTTTSVLLLDSCHSVMVMNTKVNENSMNDDRIEHAVFVQTSSCCLFQSVEANENRLIADATGYSSAFGLNASQGCALEDCRACDYLSSAPLTATSLMTTFLLRNGSENNCLRRCMVGNISTTQGYAVGFGIHQSNSNLVEECVVQGIGVTGSGTVACPQAVGFVVDSDCTILNNCVSLLIIYTPNVFASCSGFQLTANVTDNILFRCIAQNAQSTQECVRVSGFEIFTVKCNEFKECQALHNINSNTDDNSFGFVESDQYGICPVTTGNIYPRNIAAHNGSLIDNQFSGGEEMGRWVMDKTSSSAAIPSTTTFYHSLGIVA